ncbi:MAG: hypothetical protein GYA15_08195 [Leptolinea sp.]|jgi:hypothetical protein|nr:hypothetical protein [Leptolinea sp.]
MGKMEDYRQNLRSEKDIRRYLLENSNLPGPRGNLELAHAAALECPAQLLIEWSSLDIQVAPTNTNLEFLSFCGILGQGRLYLEGDPQSLERILNAASDPRWRTREAAATALQIIGKENLPALITFLPRLADGNPCEQRCAVAAICEPALLHDPATIRFALELLDKITTAFAAYPNKKEEGFIVLKKGLAYGWSVAASADLQLGKPYLEKWLQSTDRDVCQVMQENLKKNRLIRLDAAWVDRWKNTC